MSRSQFILGVTLLVVAGTLAFSISFFRSDDYRQSPSADSSQTSQKDSGRKSVSMDRSPSRSSRTVSSRSTDSSRHDLGLTIASISGLSDATLNQVNSIVNRTRQESREELDKLTEQYHLSTEQRREIFPLIVAHHDQAHPAILVNGQSLPTISGGSTLNNDIYPILDSDQQDALAEAAIDDDAWWKDVVGQLEDDLNGAIDSGEMIAVTDETSEDVGVITSSDGPAAGDGEASSHSGGNLFELLGQ
ncbi:hypothetical protein N8513_00950 [bacterium]|nr:hypothetical protein [bacterium]MDA7864435.1 hypothetical protein [Akkermansiaceae bacterium]MDA7932088.1 hypothetical protein [Akkermansiaceae bacterium]MDA8972923.1 hypothetical protein [bacterium]MDB4142177.1 hypothetical protein [Akkermansiaceae bacterium]